MSVPKLDLILERVSPGHGVENFHFWACRGTGRGCKRNLAREKKKHCDDCVSTHVGETIGDLHDRMKRGDA